MWIDARSSLHPIHSGTDGLEGYVDLELGPGGEVDSRPGRAGSCRCLSAGCHSGNRLEDRELQKRIDARRYPTIEGVLGQDGAAR